MLATCIASLSLQLRGGAHGFPNFTGGETESKSPGSVLGSHLVRTQQGFWLDRAHDWERARPWVWRLPTWPCLSHHPSSTPWLLSPSSRGLSRSPSQAEGSPESTSLANLAARSLSPGAAGASGSWSPEPPTPPVQPHTQPSSALLGCSPRGRPGKEVPGRGPPPASRCSYLGGWASLPRRGTPGPPWQALDSLLTSVTSASSRKFWLLEKEHTPRMTCKNVFEAERVTQAP